MDGKAQGLFERSEFDQNEHDQNSRSEFRKYLMILAENLSEVSSEST